MLLYVCLIPVVGCGYNVVLVVVNKSHLCVRVCVCACACVRERESEGARVFARASERASARESFYGTIKGLLRLYEGCIKAPLL